MPDNSQSTAVATREPEKQHPVAALMTSKQARAYIEPFLPKGTDIQRVGAALMLAMKKDESGKLRQCTPESLILGMARILQWGAELGTTAYLLPFKNKKTGKMEATPTRDYKFLAALSAACGYPLEAHAVRQGDEFDYKFGLNPVLEHRPRAGKKAPVTHAYVIIHPPRNANPIFDVMTAEEIDAVRQQYSKQWKDGPLLDWYAVKTVLRRAKKLLPDDPALTRFIQAVQEDEAAEVDAIAGAPTARVVGEDTGDAATSADQHGKGEELEEEYDFLDDRDLDDEDRR